MIEIDEKYHASLREAFEIVGQLCFGESWNSSVINNKKSLEYKTCDKNLRKAIESGKVKGFYRDFAENHLRKMNPQIVLEPLLHFDYQENCMIDRAAMPHGAACFINIDDLRDYFEKRSNRPEATRSTVRAETETLKWLESIDVNTFLQKKKAGLQKEAMEKFAISKRGFDRQWAKLKNKPELRGRPKIATPK
jgi:hypothetical protein